MPTPKEQVLGTGRNHDTRAGGLQLREVVRSSPYSWCSRKICIEIFVESAAQF